MRKLRVVSSPQPSAMDVFCRGIQNVGVFLLVCGCLQAVTITPLPYKEHRQRQIQGNYHTKGFAKITIEDKPVTGFEPGYRIPRGSATFLDQDEGNRVRRQMLADRGSPGFWGGNEDRRGGYDERRSYDGNRYYGNEVDRDTFYDKNRNDFVYYPNYNPQPSSSNRRDYECEPRGRPYNGNNYGSSGFQGERGYDNNGYRGHNGRGGGRNDYDDRNIGGYNGNRGRRYDDNRYQPRQDWNRNGHTGDQWAGRGSYSGGKSSYDDRDRDDTIGEGTVGFYGRTRRP